MILLDDFKEVMWIATSEGFEFYLTYDQIDEYRRMFPLINVPRKIHEFATVGGGGCLSFLGLDIGKATLTPY